MRNGDCIHYTLNINTIEFASKYTGQLVFSQRTYLVISAEVPLFNIFFICYSLVVYTDILEKCGKLTIITFLFQKINVYMNCFKLILLFLLHTGNE